MSPTRPASAASSQHAAACADWISQEMAPGNEAQADIWVCEPVALTDEPPLEASIRTGGKRRGGAGP